MIVKINDLYEKLEFKLREVVTYSLNFFVFSMKIIQLSGEEEILLAKNKEGLWISTYKKIEIISPHH